MWAIRWTSGALYAELAGAVRIGCDLMIQAEGPSGVRWGPGAHHQCRAFLQRATLVGGCRGAHWRVQGHPPDSRVRARGKHRCGDLRDGPSDRSCRRCRLGLPPRGTTPRSARGDRPTLMERGGSGIGSLDGPRAPCSPMAVPRTAFPARTSPPSGWSTSRCRSRYLKPS